MADQEKTVVERIHRGVRWGVVTHHDRRVLKFANDAETDIDSYALSDAEAHAIALALVTPRAQAEASE